MSITLSCFKNKSLQLQTKAEQSLLDFEVFNMYVVGL